MDTNAPSELLNTRFAYVSVSRAEHDARIYTNDADRLGPKLSEETSKHSAVEFTKSPEIAPNAFEQGYAQNQQQSNGPRMSM